jgi:hypothetical protein
MNAHHGDTETQRKLKRMQTDLRLTGYSGEQPQPALPNDLEQLKAVGSTVKPNWIEIHE